MQQESPTVTIKYLPTRTTYTIRLRADNLSGYGPWSSSKTIYLPDSEQQSYAAACPHQRARPEPAEPAD